MDHGKLYKCPKCGAGRLYVDGSSSLPFPWAQATPPDPLPPLPAALAHFDGMCQQCDQPMDVTEGRVDTVVRPDGSTLISVASAVPGATATVEFSGPAWANQ